MTNTIRDDRRFRQVMPHEQLKKVFGRGIYPQDIDGEVEMDGHFLWLEWKRSGVDMPKAQELANFKRLLRVGDFGTLFVISHNSDGNAVEPENVKAFSICRRDRWLENHKHYAIWQCFIFDGWECLCDWLREWVLRTKESPNSFVSDFRKQQCIEHIVSMKDRPC